MKLTLVSFFFTFFMHLPLTQTQKPIFVGILRSKVRLGVPLSEGFSEVCLQSTNHSMLTLEPGNFHSPTNRRLYIIGVSTGGQYCCEEEKLATHRLFDDIDCSAS